MTDVTIVIIEYYCIDDVVKAVDSANKCLKGIDWQAIVVSNSEYDEDGVAALKSAVPDANVIISPINGGYAGGVNLALKEISDPYVFLLNPDGRFQDNNLSLLIEEMESNDRLAIIGPKVVDEAGIVQPSCRRFPRLYTFLLVRSIFRILPGAAAERSRYLMEDFDRTQKRFVDWVSGGAMLIKKKMADDIGGMDELYFLYMEDVDWCRNCKIHGWLVAYDPRSTIVHSGRHSSIDNGLLGVLNKTTRWHLMSLWKFFRKWGIS